MISQHGQIQTALHGYAVEFSPFADNLLSVGTAQHFGIIGNGQQSIYKILPNGSLAPIRHFDTPEGIYDCAWSEMQPNQLVSACADGSIRLWHLETRDNFPIRMYQEHTQEVAGINWNLVSKDSFVSSSWDGLIKIWRPEMPQSLITFSHCENAVVPPAHLSNAKSSSPVYNAVWNSQNASAFASCSGDGTIKCWDIAAGSCTSVILAHTNEVLALDWNHYNPYELVSGSANRSIRTWDIRNSSQPLREFLGHSYAVRRVKWSPHDANVFGSTSYDMSIRLWNTKSPFPELQHAQHHTEFTFGLDFSLFSEGLVASCAWDRRVVTWNYFGGPPTL